MLKRHVTPTCFVSDSSQYDTIWLNLRSAARPIFWCDELLRQSNLITCYYIQLKRRVAVCTYPYAGWDDDISIFERASSDEHIQKIIVITYE